MKKILLAFLFTSILLGEWKDWEVVQDKGERFKNTIGNYYTRTSFITNDTDMILTIEKIGKKDMMVLKLKKNEITSINKNHELSIKIDNLEEIKLIGVSGKDMIMIFSGSEEKLGFSINQMKKGKSMVIKTIIADKNKEIVIPLNNFKNSYKQLK